MTVPENLSTPPEHEWVSIDGTVRRSASPTMRSKSGDVAWPCPPRGRP
jgi:hypothetical protein